MSAQTEVLLEQIVALEAAIAAGEKAGMDVSTLKASLEQHRLRLIACNMALNENKQVLKG